MGLFGRNKGGSGQNPLPTKGQIEAHMVKVGDKWVPKGFACGSDVYYDKPEQPQKPPMPSFTPSLGNQRPPINPNARSFGNEAPPREMRKPPTNEGVDKMKTIQNFMVNVPNAYYSELYMTEVKKILSQSAVTNQVEESFDNGKAILDVGILATEDDGIYVRGLIENVFGPETIGFFERAIEVKCPIS